MPVGLVILAVLLGCGRLDYDPLAGPSDWEEVDGSASGGGLSASPVAAYNPYLSVDEQGRPAVVWAANFDSYSEIHGKWFRDGTWQEISPDSATGAGISGNGLGADLPRLEFRADGAPVVVWYEWGDNAEVLAKVLVGGAWQGVSSSSGGGGGITSNVGISRSPFLAVDAMDVIVAWQDTTFGNFDIMVAHSSGQTFTGYGSSFGDGGISATGGRSEHPKVALDDSGQLFVAYEDDTSGTYDVFVRTFSALTNSWELLGGGSASGDSGFDSRFPDLVIDTMGRPVVAWTETALTDEASFVYARRLEGGVWRELSPGSARGTGLVPDGAASAMGDLEIDKDGNIWLAYTNSSSGRPQAYVTLFNGTSWREVGAGSMTGTGVSDSELDELSSPDLAVTKEGFAYLIWSADAGGGAHQIYGRIYRP